MGVDNGGGGIYLSSSSCRHKVIWSYLNELDRSMRTIFLRILLIVNLNAKRIDRACLDALAPYWIELKNLLDGFGCLRAQLMDELRPQDQAVRRLLEGHLHDVEDASRVLSRDAIALLCEQLYLGDSLCCLRCSGLISLRYWRVLIDASLHIERIRLVPPQLSLFLSLIRGADFAARFKELALKVTDLGCFHPRIQRRLLTFVYFGLSLLVEFLVALVQLVWTAILLLLLRGLVEGLLLEVHFRHLLILLTRLVR